MKHIKEKTENGSANVSSIKINKLNQKQTTENVINNNSLLLITFICFATWDWFEIYLTEFPVKLNEIEIDAVMCSLDLSLCTELISKRTKRISSNFKYFPGIVAYISRNFSHSYTIDDFMWNQSLKYGLSFWLATKTNNSISWGMMAIDSYQIFPAIINSNFHQILKYRLIISIAVSVCSEFKSTAKHFLYPFTSVIKNSGESPASIPKTNSTVSHWVLCSGLTENIWF